MTYHLGSSDGPGNVSTPIQLRGENYDEGVRAVLTTLKAKRKFGFIDGTIEKTTDDEKLEDWIAIYSMLVSWLTNTLDSSVRFILGEYDDAKLLWDNFKNRFCVVNETRICQLKSALGECKQEIYESITAYFGRLTKIWDELVTYVTMSSCKCGACKYDILAQVETLRQEDYLHYFLIGLDSPYASIRAQLLTQEPLPSVDQAYQSLIQMERLHGGESCGNVEKIN